MDAKIVLNLKTYEQATGAKAVALSKLCEEVAKESGAEIIVCPQAADLYRVAQEVEIPVYAQGMENVGYGSNTGHLLPEAMAETGISGCLLNHSENRLRLDILDALVWKLRQMKLTSIVCTNNIYVSKAAAALHPDYVAIEPPELIGSGISVSQAQPELITDSVAKVQKIDSEVQVLTGAGISTGDDVKKAIELGTVGVLLASGVTKAKDPKAVLLDLVAGLE